MINQNFALQFIRRIKAQTDYNVNIMNEHGVIIASCDDMRIGSFHAAAYQMIQSNTSVHITKDLTDDLPGVTSPGVNLLLRENLRPSGVIGVSGDPDTVFPLARLIKLSFESLYDYELQRRFSPVASSEEMNRLARLLFIDRPVNLPRIRDLSSGLGIQEHVHRYPVLIEYTGVERADHVFPLFFSSYRKFSHFSPQDLLFSLSGNLLMLCKHLDELTVDSFRQELRSCVEEIDSWFEAQSPGKQNHYICGTVQNSFRQYAAIYEDMLWLYSYREKKENRLYFLTDYLTEFMMSRVSAEALSPLLDIHVSLIRQHMDEAVFRETVGALIETNMNLGEAAELLYLHKNTVASRVKKIKDLLGISPLTNIRDAVFITALYYYLSFA